MRLCESGIHCLESHLHLTLENWFILTESLSVKGGEKGMLK